jgi:hypothetical protein
MHAYVTPLGSHEHLQEIRGSKLMDSLEVDEAISYTFISFKWAIYRLPLKELRKIRHDVLRFTTIYM